MGKRKERRDRDAAGIGPYARERENLVPFSRLRGWNIAKDEADIRSWEVKTVSGRLLGVVRELLVDADAGEVVMIEVDLAGSDRHACLPLRIVEIDRGRRVVRADSGDVAEYDSTGDGWAAADRSVAPHRAITYRGTMPERVVERRPIVEETVVRRRTVDEEDTRL